LPQKKELLLYFFAMKAESIALGLGKDLNVVSFFCPLQEQGTAVEF
jgi:hypothetical protein